MIFADSSYFIALAREKDRYIETTPEKKRSS
jgi:hypothetical protein